MKYTYHIGPDGHKKLCSGYGVYPNGEKCKGCMDCEGRFLKKSASKKQLAEIVNKNHSIVTVKGKRVNKVKR